MSRLQWLYTAILAVAFFYAPLAYGSTTLVTQLGLDMILALAVFCWVFDQRLRWFQARREQWLFWTLGILLFLNLQAWVMALNAPVTFDRATGQFLVESGSFEWIPASIDRADSMTAARHTTLLSLLFVSLLDMLAIRRVRKWLVGSLVLSGTLVALIGIFQKASGTESMLFTDKTYANRLFFAAYRYHGNAATFMNFCWPLALALYLRALIKPVAVWEKPLWGGCLLLLLIGLWVNTSKAGHLLFLLGMVIAAYLYRSLLVQYIRDWRRYKLAWIGLGVALVIGMGFVSMRWELMLERWQNFSGSLTPRIEVALDCIRLLPDSGWLGTGPGTFGVFFDRYKEPGLQGYWTFAHNDYLQVLLEWGWFGGGLWIGGWLAGLTRGIAQLKAGELINRGAVVALLLVLIHAVADFPFYIASLNTVAVFVLGLLLVSVRKHKPVHKDSAGV